MRKESRTDRGGLPATILFRCPKDTSESDFKHALNRSFTDIFNIPLGQRIMNTEYLAQTDSIRCYFRVGEAASGHGFMLLPPDHPEYSGPFIETCPLFAVSLGHTLSYASVERSDLDKLDVENERFAYAAKVNEYLRGIKMIDWEEFQKITKSILVAHLMEGQRGVAMMLEPKNEDCVWTPLLNDVLHMGSTKPRV